MKDEVQLKKYLPSLIFAIILPVIAYLFLKMLGNSDTLALGIATAFPVVHMLWSLIRKKELNPVSLVAIIGFLISLLAVYLTHGNNLAFKLWHPILTAAIGTIFLLSVLLNNDSFYGLGFYFSCFVSHFISLFCRDHGFRFAFKGNRFFSRWCPCFRACIFKKKIKLISFII